MLLALVMVAVVAAAEPEEPLRIEVGRISVVEGSETVVSFALSDAAVARAERLGEHILVVGVGVGEADWLRPGELAELWPAYEGTTFLLADSNALTATHVDDRYLVLCAAGWGTTDIAIQLPNRPDAIVLTYPCREIPPS